MHKRSVDPSTTVRTKLAGALLCIVGLLPAAAWAGPPFLTDDPEPVEYKHGEFYIAGQMANASGGFATTAPHLELNYGALPDVHLHVIAPLAMARATGGPTYYGLGDLELGVKYRFVHETETMPQIGVFPLLFVPTGNSDRGLGTGQVGALLPIWLQKGFGPWTTYGGAGYAINPGTGNSNYLQAGWLVQREIVKALTIGTELFFQTKRTTDGDKRVAFNVGSVINLTDDYHLLLSAGRDIKGDNNFIGYAAVQWTFGPHEDGGHEEKK